MSFQLMTDKEIVKQLGEGFDLLRRSKSVPDKEVLSKGGSNFSALNKFRGHSGNITVESLVKLMRGIGELDRLESLFNAPYQYSPTSGKKTTPLKRIRKSASRDFKWKDES